MLIAGLCLVTLAGRDIYVSDTGSDDRKGQSWSQAFRTLEHAKAVVSQKRDVWITVHLKGTFRLSAPFVLGSECSKSEWVGVHGAALSGAALISNWKEDHFNGRPVWSAAAPAGVDIRELFAGTSHFRATRTRLPKTGFYQFAGLTNGADKGPWNEGQMEAIAPPGIFKEWKNLGDVEVVAHHYWVSSRLPVKSFDPVTNLVSFQKKSVFRLTDDYTGKAAPFYVENVGEALTQPGEWYWDRGAGRVYYIPRRGDRLSSFFAEAPVTANVLTLDHVEGATFGGIEFRGAEWTYPASASGDGQAAISVPAAVQILQSKNCRFDKCRVEHSGTYGFEVANGSTETRIVDCTISDMGGGGVKIGHGTSRTTLSNCRIENDGLVHASAVGVWIGNSGGNVISHNTIRRLGYTGISVGWTWGYGPSDAKNNLIEWNAISDIGQGLLSDMGGIYTLGVSPGTILRDNRISNVISRGYGGWGIYLDEGSSHIRVEDNWVSGCKTGSFHQHYGQDNRIENNVFAFARQDGQIIRTRPEDHNSFTMDHNVVVWKGTPLFGGNLQGPGFVFLDNLLWRADSAVELPAFIDKTNRVEEPKFIDVAHNDYRLEPNSHVSYELQHLDLRTAGVGTPKLVLRWSDRKSRSGEYPTNGYVDLQVFDIDVRDLLARMCTMGGATFSIAAEVRGTVSLSLNHVTWETALQHIVRQVGATYRAEPSCEFVNRDQT